jgi:2-aminobenzoylacetyl-CoA thioesterase
LSFCLSPPALSVTLEALPEGAEEEETMIITQPGPITERITQLGRTESCVQLIDGGEQIALVGGAMNYVLPEIFEQIERFDVDVERIGYLIVLHAHFDHCGIIPALKRRWPWAVVAASPRAAELLAKKKVSDSIAFMNAGAAARYDRTEAVEALEGGFTGIEVEQTLVDGQRISLGDRILEMLAVPGHSSCSIALYVPEEKALFPSDAAGISHEDYFFSAGNSNFDQYVEGLKRLSRLDVEVICREHFGSRLGEDARAALPLALREAERTRAILVDCFRRRGDQARATDEAVTTLMEGAPEDFLPREVLQIVVGQMIKHIARVEPTVE